MLRHFTSGSYWHWYLLIWQWALTLGILQGSRIRCVLGCVIPRAGAVARSLNLGQALFGSPVEALTFKAFPAFCNGQLKTILKWLRESRGYDSVLLTHNWNSRKLDLASFYPGDRSLLFFLQTSSALIDFHSGENQFKVDYGTAQRFF